MKIDQDYRNKKIEKNIKNCYCNYFRAGKNFRYFRSVKKNPNIRMKKIRNLKKIPKKESPKKVLKYEIFIKTLILNKFHFE